MTIKRLVEIKCPKCQTKVETMIWDSLNVAVDPKAKKDLLEGKINLFECSKCDYKELLPVSFLYHDMENDFCVQYYPFERIGDRDFFDEFTKDARLKIDFPVPEHLKHAAYLKAPHIVFSLEELVRYVIFRDRLRIAKQT